MLFGGAILVTLNMLRLEAYAQPALPFDELTGAELGFFDVYLGGRSLGSFVIEFDGSRFRFDDVGELLPTLPLVEQRETVTAILTDILERNSDKVCSVRISIEQGKCGLLEPEVIAAILDVSNFRIELFINPALLPEALGDSASFLPPQKKAPAAIFNTRLLLSGTFPDTPSTALSANGSIAFGGGRFNTRLSAGTNGFRVDDLNYIYDLETRKISAGVISMSSIPLVGFSDIVGVQVRSSYDRLLNRSSLFSQPLEIFLQRRARVEIFRDDQLLHNATYDAGNQRLNTSDLPSGSYLVRIRIIDPISGTTEIERVFVNLESGGPIGTTTYGVEVGAGRNRGVNDVFEPITNTIVGRVNVSHRFGASIRGFADLAVAGKEKLIAGGAEYFGTNTSFRASLIANSLGGAGAEGYATIRGGNTTLSLSGRWLDGTNAKPDTFQLVTGRFQSYSATVTRPFGRVSTGVRGRLSKIGESGSNWSINPFVRWSLGQIGGMQVFLSGEGNITNEERGVFLRLTTARLRARQTIGAEISTRYERDLERGQDALDPEFSAYFSSRHPDFAWGAARYRVDTVAAGDSQALSVDSELEANLGNISGGLSASRNSGEINVRYNAQIETGFATDGRAWALTGGDGGRSAALVTLDGATGGDFDVQINGRPSRTVRAGQTVAVGLTPYQQYRISLQPKGDTIAGFDITSKEMTAYPGTVERFSWEVYPVVLFITQVFLENGEPVASARVIGAQTVALTDDVGFLQVEARPGSKLELRLRGGGSCEITLPDESSDDIDPGRPIAILDDLICQALP